MLERYRCSTVTVINIKRIYDQPEASDGFRILVDRLWPRGLSKKKARIDLWAKDLAPSTELRRWYGHEPGKWSAFTSRYAGELQHNQAQVEEILDPIRAGPVTFLYSSTEPQWNNAVALKQYVEKLLQTGNSDH